MSREKPKMVKSIRELNKKLTPEQYEVCINRGTEAPFTGEYLHNKEKGVYKCVVCRNVLFKSDDKFDSETGWPSFTKPMKKGGVERRDDSSMLMHRTEVICSKCGAHLGHVFDDGLEPTGKRFCINSVALKFQKKK